VHNIANKMETPADEAETISMCPIESKPPDPPTKAAHSCANKSDGHRNHTDGSTGQTDTLNVSSRAGMTGISHCVNVGMYLGARDAKRAVDETDGLGGHADASSGHGNTQSVQTDVITTVNAPEIISTHPIEPKRPNSPVGDAKRSVDVADGLVSHTDTSSGHMDTPSVQTDALTPANEPQTIRIRPNDSKSQNSPMEAARQRSNEPNTCGNHANRSGVHTDVQSIAHETETPINAIKIVRMRPNDPKPPNSKMQDSLHMHETATPKPTYEWKRVSGRGINAYIPQNMPIDRTGRIFVFGRAESAGEAIVARIVNETTGNGVGDRNGGDSDVDGTTSGGNVDSIRVKAALLATESQRMRYSRRTRIRNLPVSPRPPIQSSERPYGPARRQHRHGKLKIEQINDKSVSQTPDVETAHLGHTHVTQPPRIHPERTYGLYRPRCRCGRIKFAPTNVSPMRNSETAYLRCDQIAQPRGDDPQRSYRVVGPKRRRGRLKTRPTSVSRKYKERDAHQGPYKPIHLLSLDADDPSRSTPIGNLQYSLQSVKKNLQDISRDDDKSVASSTHLSANTSISARCDLPNR